jgi:outer membrane protein OmpA-like peptidoglycan-associated protein
VTAAADGYFPRTAKVTVIRGLSGGPVMSLIPRPERHAARATAKGVSLLRPVVFMPDTAILSPESEPLLAEVAELLQKHRELKQLEIQGHDEDVGSAPGSPTLSQQRAEAVRAWLVNAGIDEARLTAKGYGNTRPLVPNITPANRARNRRIAIVVSD